MNYDVSFGRAAQRSLARIRQQEQDRLIAAIAGLAGDPRPPGSKKLRGREAWRIRVGSYRVIYEIDDEHHKVLVVAVGNRRDIYRR